MVRFDHEKMHVYNASIEFVTLIDNIIKQLPRGRSHLADQLHRAGTSVPLNIAEGAGEFSPSEKQRFYRMAKRSATECAAILDICARLDLVEKDQHTNSRVLLLRIVSMLTKLAQGQNQESRT